MINTRPKVRTSSEICADCSAPAPEWASINRGVLICDECCSVHRSLGRHVSQVRHLRLAQWHPSLLAMVRTLVSNGANLIWEHSLSDSGQMKTGIRKPNPKDQVHPIKSNFIKAKYQMLAFVHRLPISDDNMSVSDISKQLYSAVRTGNLETSLRLISLGAHPNFFHSEKGNSPLHSAAKAGQATQVELLVVNGADPSGLDSNGRTAAEVAMAEGHTDIGYRLIELMFELTDRLTFYLCGRRPDHRNGINYLIPALADRGLDASRIAKEARLKLQSLNDRLFEELASDVYDEVSRRENDGIWLATQHHRKLVSDHTIVPFLPVNPAFTSTRNQGRQKLARFNALEFTTLIVDILHDARRREVSSNGSQATTGLVENRTEHDYDDPDHDYDEVHSIDSRRASQVILTEIENKVTRKTDEDNNTKNNNDMKTKDDSCLDVRKGSIEKKDKDDHSLDEKGRGSASSDEGRYVSMEEYRGLKKQLSDSEDRSTQLQRLNDTLAQEVNLLRSMVQKLMQENASLRAQVSQAESRKEELENHFAQMQEGSLNDVVMLEKLNDTDSDHIPIDNISPHQTSGNSQRFFNSEPDRSTPPFHSSPSYSNVVSSNDAKLKNPYDNISPVIKSSNPIVVSVTSRKKTSEELKSSMDAFNGNQQSPQEYPVSSEDSAAFITDDENPDVQSPEDAVPTQEDIVKATEQITKKIQELLLQAQAGRHSRYIPCSSNISTAVNDMANLFPKHPRQENVRSALRLMITSAARLQVECRSSVLPDRTIDAAMLTQQVIQCAYDIAKAAKQLVTTYNQA